MRLKLGLSLLIFGLSNFAWAGARGLPDFALDYPALTLHQFVLGSTCLSLPAAHLDLNCNPALMAHEEKRQLRADLVVSDRIGKVNDFRVRLDNEDTFGIVDGLLRDHDPLIAKAAVSVWYQRENWAVGIVPARAGYGSIVRNNAYPEISAHIYRDLELFYRGGWILQNDRHFQVGAQVRYTERQFFLRDFALLDALADPRILRVEKRKAVFIEPAVTYTFDSAWSSALSLTATNLAVWESGSTDSFRPIFDIGFSTAPGFADGRLRTTTHYTFRHDSRDMLHNFAVGTIYEFNRDLAASMSLGRTSFGIGLSGNVDSLVLGLAFKAEEIPNEVWESRYISSVLFNVGLKF